ncbi:MAG: hypothetical protein AB7F40_03950 [Victivallaceae bacterium]|nr:hypothetical protein [Victivallaceae bacterium]
MKKIGWFLGVVAVIFAAGCAERIPVEDPLAVTVCAEEIKILKDPTLSANSQAKHEAAIRLTEQVDFSYTRNVATLLKFFSASDAHTSDDATILVFSYPYRKNDVQFRFRCSGTTVVSSEVVEK